LTRTTRSVAPTEARLLRNVGPRLDEIDAELTALRELREKPAGTIRITAGEHAADRIPWPALARLLPNYPDKPGETFKDCPECPEMVVVPAGSFIMGSPGKRGRSHSF
jgi:DNA-binding transcriptional LysR family regulator